ncbi:MAG TPA: DUF695 domain-containing protein [Ohtaekwangia sp.]|uniref:DUF695 domain-containing protein n=1 Tax=Ohtaekwangia sp. TaxID=2066019 RepID=UPI002F937F02
MGLLKNLFGKKEEPIASYADFWNWFQKNEKGLRKAVKTGNNIETDFFEVLAPKLDELREGFQFVTGMEDDDTVRLIFTADGVIKNIVFVEELVEAAPPLDGWIFIAHKPERDLLNIKIVMEEYEFREDNLHFFSNDHDDLPDEIDITVVHDDYTEENKEAIEHGINLFLDNYLGELNFATIIDNISVVSKDEATKELVSIEKLKSFLIWRQKEFIEKYDSTQHNSENDDFAGLEATKDDKPLLAVINTTLLDWDRKASHPWITIIEIKYDGTDNDGMPDEETYALLDEIENKIVSELSEAEGHLNIGRETCDNTQEIYFACKDFRKPSLVLPELLHQYSDKFELDFTIYKDKYWQSFSRFSNIELE